MSRIYLTHFSAFAILRYARAHKAKISYYKAPSKFVSDPSKDELHTIHELTCQLAGQQFCLDVFLRPTNKKKKWAFVQQHFINAKLSGRHFVKISVDDPTLQAALFDKIAVTSEALTYFLLAKCVPEHRLILMGLELCGTYALDLDNEAGFIGNLPPATNINSLAMACKTFTGQHLSNSRKATDALKWIAENSASPAESKLFLFLCGPRKLGFLQVKKLSLNSSITLSSEAKSICGFTNIRPDLCCMEHKLAIEYDSWAFHTETSSNQNDKARSLALQHDGWKVISIVPAELKNFDIFYVIAKDILLYMGQDTRIRNKAFWKKCKKAFDDVNQIGHRK